METLSAAKRLELDPTLISEVRRLRLRSRRRVNADLLGQYRAAFRGSGLIFTDIREYTPGDDTKHIHWKLTARSATGNAFVKSYEEDRQLNVLLAVDASSSTDFGAGRSKHERALEFCALVALLAKNSKDSVGMLRFSGEVEEFYPPSRKNSQFDKIFSRLLSLTPLTPSTDLRAALSFLNERQRRPSIIFIVSDFLTAPFEDQLRLLAAKHDVVCALLEHDFDRSLPSCGIVEFIDAESGTRVLVDTSHKPSLQRLALLSEQRRELLTKTCRRAGAELMLLSDNPVRPLAELMERRKARMK
ncbi:MAG: DUF58 domain-containing protein [Deltaproteobacteria bacterium]|nr:DUF58 domain-containing protein [Deltaproteobacteria bacterium]